MGTYFVLADRITALCDKLEREGKLQQLFDGHLGRLTGQAHRNRLESGLSLKDDGEHVLSLPPNLTLWA